MGISRSLLLGNPKSFDPRNVANLKWWIDASQSGSVLSTPGGAPAVVAGPCGQINDLSGGGFNCSQSTVANQPIWTPGLQAGKPGLVCDTTDFFDTIAGTLSFGASITMIVVANITNAAANKTICDGDFSSFLFRFDTSNKQDIVRSGAVDIGTGTSAVPTGVASLTTITYDFSGATYRLNGIANGTNSPSGTMANNTTVFLSAGGGSGQFQSTFYEMRVYARVLTASEIALNEASLNSKWRIY